MCELIAHEKRLDTFNPSIYDKVKEEILDRDKELKEKISENTKKLLEKLETKKNKYTQTFEEEKKITQSGVTFLKQELDGTNALLKFNNLNKVFNVKESGLNQILENLEKPKTVVTVPKLCPLESFSNSLLYGFLMDVSVSLTFETKADFNIPFQWETDSPFINFVSCNDDSLWINDTEADTLTKVLLLEDKIIKLPSIKMSYYAMAVTPSGSLLLSCQLSKLLELPKEVIEIKESCYDISPLITKTIHVTKNNKVMITGAEDIDRSYERPRKIIVMDSKGKYEMEYEYDNNKKQLFTLPDIIVTTSENNVGVVDMELGREKGRVVVLDEGGRVLNIYTGHNELNKQGYFDPLGLVVTSCDNFIVADSSILHILDKEGQIISFFDTTNWGVFTIMYGMQISDEDQLFISCFELFTLKNKLYKIECDIVKSTSDNQ
ncbi:uncharacterized protein LOC127711903 [Mytilus californianus]|uniref:uncharacterized protein LOC127711903 n=1 Tax=Mytilus californianus TaxID=6549 RepID=UPI002247CDB9|nr:uncharacterized protein LOC127711903 [Mytilus californianus]